MKNRARFVWLSMSCSFAAEMGKFVKSLDEQNFEPKVAITAGEALNGNNNWFTERVSFYLGCVSPVQIGGRID